MKSILIYYRPRYDDWFVRYRSESNVSSSDSYKTYDKALESINFYVEKYKLTLVEWDLSAQIALWEKQ